VIFYYTISYVIKPALFVNPVTTVVGWVIMLYGMYRATGIPSPSDVGGTKIKDNIRKSFLVFVIAYGIFEIYRYLMFNVVDPTLPAITKEAMKSLSESFMPKGTTPDQVNQMRQALESEDYSLTIKSLLMDFAIKLIVGFILAFVIAAAKNILKRPAKPLNN